MKKTEQDILRLLESVKGRYRNIVFGTSNGGNVGANVSVSLDMTVNGQNYINGKAANNIPPGRCVAILTDSGWQIYSSNSPELIREDVAIMRRVRPSSTNPISAKILYGIVYTTETNNPYKIYIGGDRGGSKLLIDTILDPNGGFYKTLNFGLTVTGYGLNNYLAFCSKNDLTNNKEITYLFKNGQLELLEKPFNSQLRSLFNNFGGGFYTSEVYTGNRVVYSIPETGELLDHAYSLATTQRSGNIYDNPNVYIYTYAQRVYFNQTEEFLYGTGYFNDEYTDAAIGVDTGSFSIPVKLTPYHLKTFTSTYSKNNLKPIVNNSIDNYFYNVFISHDNTQGIYIEVNDHLVSQKDSNDIYRLTSISSNPVKIKRWQYNKISENLTEKEFELKTNFATNALTNSINLSDVSIGDSINIPTNSVVIDYDPFLFQSYSQYYSAFIKNYGFADINTFVLSPHYPFEFRRMTDVPTYLTDLTNLPIYFVKKIDNTSHKAIKVIGYIESFTYTNLSPRVYRLNSVTMRVQKKVSLFNYRSLLLQETESGVNGFLRTNNGSINCILHLMPNYTFMKGNKIYIAPSIINYLAYEINDLLIRDFIGKDGFLDFEEWEIIENSSGKLEVYLKDNPKRISVKAIQSDNPNSTFGYGTNVYF